MIKIFTFFFLRNRHTPIGTGVDRRPVEILGWRQHTSKLLITFELPTGESDLVPQRRKSILYITLNSNTTLSFLVKTYFISNVQVNKTYTTTIPLNPDLWEPSSSFSVLEVGTEEQMQHPRYQVGGSQQEISSSQLKIPITSPEITVYTAYSPVPKVPNDNHREHKYYENIERGKSGLTESSVLDYPLPINTIPLKITKIRLQPGFGGVVKLKCEATIYDVYKVSSEIVKIREETPHIALVMGQSSTGNIDFMNKY